MKQTERIIRHIHDYGSIPYVEGRRAGSIPYLEGWRDGVLAFNGNVPTKIMRPANEQRDYLEGFKHAVQFMKEGE